MTDALSAHYPVFSHDACQDALVKAEAEIARLRTENNRLVYEKDKSADSHVRAHDRLLKAFLVLETTMGFYANPEGDDWEEAAAALKKARAILGTEIHEDK